MHVRMPPLVSAIVPVYDTPLSLVRESIASVAGQTFHQHLELVVFDDGSSPEHKMRLKEVLNEVSDEIPIIVGETECNRGPGPARNDAVKMARGEYLIFLDSDDILHPIAVERCVRSFSEKVDLVYTNSVTVSRDMKSIIQERDKRVYHRLLFQFKGTVFDPLLHSTFVFQARMVRRATFLELGGFRDGVFAGGENVDLNLRLSELSSGVNFALVPETLYYYRDNPLSVTHDQVLRSRVTATIEHVIVEAARRRGYGIAKAQRLGRALPTHSSHYTLLDERGRIVHAPYFDYDLCQIRREYLVGHMVE